MNNREAAKALLEGKTLRIINKSQKDITYKFDKEVLGIVTSAEDIYWNIKDFNDDCEWEEVKELYKKEVIVTCDENGYIKECERFYPYQDERANKKYKLIIEEIIKWI